MFCLKISNDWKQQTWENDGGSKCSHVHTRLAERAFRELFKNNKGLQSTFQQFQDTITLQEYIPNKDKALRMAKNGEFNMVYTTSKRDCQAEKERAEQNKDLDDEKFHSGVWTVLNEKQVDSVFGDSSNSKQLKIKFYFVTQKKNSQ